MKHSARGMWWRDPLYGLVAHEDALSQLAQAPIVQRLRHIRLSNIDSMDLPSIANLSRYEHVLGVAYLARQAPIRKTFSDLEVLAFDAAALLHDWAITAYGHLIEEALQYVGTGFNHERKLAEIATAPSDSDVGGLSDRQVLHGRGVGLVRWARKVTGSVAESEQLVTLISDFVNGRGVAGRLIAGTIDIDNIDNVFRMAYHLGLAIDKECPLRLARAITEVDKQTGEPIFAPEAVRDIETWIETRRRVYDLLMLAERDFAGKTMLIYAATMAFKAGDILDADWTLTDDKMLAKILSSSSAARDAAERWQCGEVWDMAPLVWMSGTRPDYTELMSFSEDVSLELGREFFVYGIKDKRERLLSLNIKDSGPMRMGSQSDQWLLGFGSPKRAPITKKECEQAWALAENRLGAHLRGRASHDHLDSQRAPWLI